MLPKPCDHKDSIRYETTWLGLNYSPRVTAICIRCFLSGETSLSHGSAKKSLEEKALQIHRQWLLNTLVEAGFKDPSNLVKWAEVDWGFPETGIRTAAGANLLHNSVNNADIRNQASTVVTKTMPVADIMKQFNLSYKQMMEKTMPIVPPATLTPYWIIVSDEGHSANPAKHLTKAAAQTEAERLSKTKPGVNFVVFKSEEKFFTPKAETQKTGFKDLPQYNYWIGYPNKYYHVADPFHY